MRFYRLDTQRIRDLAAGIGMDAATARRLIDPLASVLIGHPVADVGAVEDWIARAHPEWRERSLGSRKTARRDLHVVTRSKKPCKIF